MNKELIERLALEAYEKQMNQELRPQDKPGVFGVCEEFLSAVDAERGKEACADPIAWRNIASPNGIRRFMTQKQYDADLNLQKYYEPFTCARCADAEQLHYKEMAERTVQEEFLLAAHADLEAKITEQAEELRIIRANLAQLEKDFDQRNEVVDAQVERIKALEPKS